MTDNVTSPADTYRRRRYTLVVSEILQWERGKLQADLRADALERTDLAHLSCLVNVVCERHFI